MPEGRSVNVNAPQPAKEALRPGEQDCRLIVDSISAHVVTLTAHGDIEFVNQQWLDYLGKALDELQSWTNSSVVHPDDLSRVVSTWNRSVETGQPYEPECRFCRADGVFRWFHVRAIPEREAEGRIVRWYCLHTDIDERKQAENRLQLLLDVTNQVVSNLQIDDLLRAISASVRRVMQCDVVYVCLPGSDVSRLRGFVLDFPESKGFIREDSVSIEGSIAGIVFRTAKPWMGNGADLLQLGVKDDPGIAEGLNTGCVLPLIITGNRVLGVLALGRREEHGFTQVDFGFLIQVANQIAIAIENSSAYHESTSARAYLEECLEEIQSLEDRLQDENLVLREQIDQALMFEEIVGTSSALQAVLSLASKVAPMDSTVLLTGETGTGKELIARAIHKRSRRSSRPFVGVNCAAIPASLIGSESFGHEKGGFYGRPAAAAGSLRGCRERHALP